MQLVALPLPLVECVWVPSNAQPPAGEGPMNTKTLQQHPLTGGLGSWGGDLGAGQASYLPALLTRPSLGRSLRSQAGIHALRHAPTWEGCQIKGAANQQQPAAIALDWTVPSFILSGISL